MDLKTIVERLEKIERIPEWGGVGDMQVALSELRRDIEMYLLKTTGTR